MPESPIVDETVMQKVFRMRYLTTGDVNVVAK